MSSLIQKTLGDEAGGFIQQATAKGASVADRNTAVGNLVGLVNQNVNMKAPSIGYSPGTNKVNVSSGAGGRFSTNLADTEGGLIRQVHGMLSEHSDVYKGHLSTAKKARRAELTDQRARKKFQNQNFHDMDAHKHLSKREKGEMDQFYRGQESVQKGYREGRYPGRSAADVSGMSRTERKSLVEQAAAFEAGGGTTGAGTTQSDLFRGGKNRNKGQTEDGFLAGDTGDTLVSEVAHRTSMPAVREKGAWNPKSSTPRHEFDEEGYKLFKRGMQDEFEKAGGQGKVSDVYRARDMNPSSEARGAFGRAGDERSRLVHAAKKADMSPEHFAMREMGQEAAAFQQGAVRDQLPRINEATNEFFQGVISQTAESANATNFMKTAVEAVSPFHATGRANISSVAESGGEFMKQNASYLADAAGKHMAGAVVGAGAVTMSEGEITASGLARGAMAGIGGGIVGRMAAGSLQGGALNQMGKQFGGALSGVSKEGRVGGAANKAGNWISDSMDALSSGASASTNAMRTATFAGGALAGFSMARDSNHSRGLNSGRGSRF